MQISEGLPYQILTNYGGGGTFAPYKGKFVYGLT